MIDVIKLLFIVSMWAYIWVHVLSAYNNKHNKLTKKEGFVLFLLLPHFILDRALSKLFNWLI